MANSNHFLFLLSPASNTLGKTRKADALTPSCGSLSVKPDMQFVSEKIERARKKGMEHAPSVGSPLRWCCASASASTSAVAVAGVGLGGYGNEGPIARRGLGMAAGASAGAGAGFEADEMAHVQTRS